MAWLIDWYLSLCLARKTIQQLRGEVAKLELSNHLASLEVANYKRLHEASMDTVQAFGLHNRAIGMEAKIYSADLVAKTMNPPE